MGIMDLTLFVLALHVAIHHMKDVRIFREMRHRRRRGEGASVAINRGEGENLDNPMRSIMEVIIEDSIPYYAGCVLLPHFGSFRMNSTLITGFWPCRLLTPRFG